MRIRIEKKGKKSASKMAEKTIPEYLTKFRSWHPENVFRICFPNLFRSSNLLLTIEFISFIIYKINTISECKGKGVKWREQYHIYGIFVN
jgi:hypothetical protein